MVRQMSLTEFVENILNYLIDTPAPLGIKILAIIGFIVVIKTLIGTSFNLFIYSIYLITIWREGKKWMKKKFKK